MMLLSSLTGALFFLSLLGYAFGLMLLLPRLKMGAALFSAFCGMLFVAYWGIIMLEWCGGGGEYHTKLPYKRHGQESCHHLDFAGG